MSELHAETEAAETATTAPAGDPNAVALTIELGALTEMVAPGGSVLWESHKRGRNWAASIHRDPKSPGGLGRAFWDRALGDYFYLVPGSVVPGTAVEFAADYYSGAGHPSRRRWYGFVTSVTPDRLSLVACDTPADAMKAGDAFRSASAARKAAEPAPAPEPIATAPEPAAEPAADELAAELRVMTDDQLAELAAAVKAERARRTRAARKAGKGAPGAD